MQRFIKINGYKLKCSFYLKKDLKKTSGTFPVYCSLTYKRKTTIFPVKGWRFAFTDDIPYMLIDCWFSEITTIFKEISGYYKPSIFDAFFKRYKLIVPSEVEKQFIKDQLLAMLNDDNLSVKKYCLMTGALYFS